MTVFSGEGVNKEATTDDSQGGQQNTEDQRKAGETQGEYLARLVGEGKKYKTTDDLAKAYVNADAFIENIKRENAELKEDLQKRLSAEQILEEIKKTGVNSQSTDQGDKTNPLLANEEQLLNLVDKRIEGRKKEEARQSNILEVDRVVKELYGEKAIEIVTNKAKELGVSLKWLEDAAAQSPQALFSLLGIDASKVNKSVAAPVTTKGTVNTQGLNTHSTGTKVGTWKYYQDLRKADPTKYFSPKIQNELMKQREELGDKFYS